MITFNNVTKYYLTKKGRRYVLRDANLTVELSQKIGVVGRNGAGKSTLMRLLAGVDTPDKGTITRTGSISWPLGLASGLQGILTGRENAKFACGIQGNSKSEADAKLKFIRKFSEVGPYFDMPVRTYSSGMRARINFAIAMAFDFDFYIIDELTSVGDKAFRDKARHAFQRKRNKSGFIKVSHNLAELSRECDNGLLLHDGQLTYYPDIDDAIRDYQNEIVHTRELKQQERAAKRLAAGKMPAKKRPGKKRPAKKQPARLAAEKRKAAAAGAGQNGAGQNGAGQSGAGPDVAGQQPRLVAQTPARAAQQRAVAAKPAPADPRLIMEPRPHKPAPMMPRIVRKANPDS